jgi:hypothetical protein
LTASSRWCGTLWVELRSPLSGSTKQDQTQPFASRLATPKLHVEPPEWHSVARTGPASRRSRRCRWPAPESSDRRHRDPYRPTLERCIARSRPKFSGLAIINLFAFRHTDPHLLKKVIDPVGPANDDCLRALTAAAPQTVVAWGAKGRFLHRSAAVRSLLSHPLCLGVTRTGEPRHPLYVRVDAPLQPWQPPAPAPN